MTQLNMRPKNTKIRKLSTELVHVIKVTVTSWFPWPDETGHGIREVCHCLVHAYKFYMNYFIILKFLSLEYGNTDANLCHIISEEIKQVTEITVSYFPGHARIMYNFLIFNIPDLKYGKIGH